jgi:hypothetical protein
MRILFYILFICILSSCNLSNNFSEIGNDCFVLSVPKYLQQPSDPQEGAIIHLSEDTSDFLHGLSVVVYSDNIIDESDTNTLYSYYNFVANNLLDETLESGNLETPKDTVINGLKSLIFVTCGSVNQDDSIQNVCFYTGIYQGKKKFYEVTIWCKQLNKVKYTKEIKQILVSFKEKENTSECSIFL